MREVHGKTAVVTGAASGIGRSLAEAFVDVGMRVVLSDVEEKALRATTAELRDKGADVHAEVADVSHAGDVTALAESVMDRYGAVHVLCNNAGVIGGTIPTWESTLDDWNWVLGVNLMGVVHGIRTFLPIMIEQGEEAHIVNTASAAGLIAGGGVYGTSKSAVVALSETVQMELVQGGHKPRVTVLCPGLVRTNIHHSERNRPERYSDAAAWPGDLVAAQELFLAKGKDPRGVADQVLEAIREERFYLLTHPEWTGHVEHRAAQIVAGGEVTMPELPEM